jgi:flagellin
MVINTNIQALNATANLQGSQAMLARSLARLSSGSKITNPADDAAGVAVSMRLDSQIKRTDAAKTNVINAISFTQTQDGYLKKIAKAFDRMSELTLLSQDVTKGDPDRALYQTEFQQLSAYIANTATKEFNSVSLFSSATLNVTLDSEGATFAMGGIDLSVSAYAAAQSASVATTTAALAALTAVKAAITQLANDRARIGAYQTRLNYTSDQLTISKENLSAASSRIQDVDVAEEATQYARFNILVQSGTVMLAQANQLPQNVLRLLQ